MIIFVSRSAQPTERQRAYWNWCYANGFLATEVADLAVVDLQQQTVTVRQWLPVSQPGDPDFPELRRDEHNEPLTETRRLPLRQPLPSWMVTAAGETLAA